MEQQITRATRAIPASETKRNIVSGLEAAWGQRLTTVALLLTDVLLAFLVWWGALIFQSIWGRGPLADITVASIIPAVAVWLGLRALLGLYPGYGLSSVEELRRHTYSTFGTLGAAAIFSVAFHAGEFTSRLLMFLSFLGLLFLTPLARHLVKRQLLKLGAWGRPVVIMGSGEPGSRIVRLLKEEWHLGYNPVAVFDSKVAPADGFLEGVPYGGSLTDAMFSNWESGVDTVIFAMPHTRREHLAKYVHWASSRFRQVMIMPNISGITNSAVVARDLAGTFSVEIKYNLLNPWTLRAKRVLDFAMTVAGCLVILPVILVLALLVWLESGRPIFYKDLRTGKDGKLFSCVKFRTMVPDAENLLQRLLEKDEVLREEYTRYHKLRDDPRITRIGRFLRRTSLDELPQLWNVLRGEMSLVGPRPYLPRESIDVGAAQGEILRVPPGITGPWQVSGRNSTSFSERVEIDAHYVHDWSIWLDLILLARTIQCVVLRKDAY